MDRNLIVVGLGIVSVMLVPILFAAGVGFVLPADFETRTVARIDATAPELWSRLIDHPGQTAWRSDVVAIEPLDGEAFLVRYGETAELELVQAIEEPGHALTWTTRPTEDGGFEGSWALRLQPEDGAVLVELVETGHIANPFARFFAVQVIGLDRAPRQFLADLGAAAGDDEVEFPADLE